MMAKPMKSLELHYPMIQFLIMWNMPLFKVWNEDKLNRVGEFWGFWGDLTLFEALTGGAFDHLNWQHSGEFDQIFQKSQMHRGLPGGEGHGQLWNWPVHYVTVNNAYVSRIKWIIYRLLLTRANRHRYLIAGKYFLWNWNIYSSVFSDLCAKDSYTYYFFVPPSRL